MYMTCTRQMYRTCTGHGLENLPMIRMGSTDTTEAVTIRKIEIVTRNIIHIRFCDFRFGVAIMALALLPTNCIDCFSVN